jgi:hypothetical protein
VLFSAHILVIEPCCPILVELNPVEQLWQQIKQRFLSNTTFQNYDDIIERSCQAWNEILSEDGFIKNLCKNAYLDYSMYVILERALPFVGDRIMFHNNSNLFLT